MNKEMHDLEITVGFQQYPNSAPHEHSWCIDKKSQPRRIGFLPHGHEILLYGAVFAAIPGRYYF